MASKLFAGAAREMGEEAELGSREFGGASREEKKTIMEGFEDFRSVFIKIPIYAWIIITVFFFTMALFTTEDTSKQGTGYTVGGCIFFIIFMGSYSLHMVGKTNPF